ncbi:MAG: ribose-phosphate pyrophosphokinase [Candidatus ainarchaeum sp.]|nr:ribose-phosphate pyrophosphokinase [Candidatus ainarchaeum sp.]
MVSKICLMACKNGLYFAEKILPHLNRFLKDANYSEISLTKTDEVQFRNTEIKSNILESIRGSHVFIVQDVSNKSNGYSVSDNVLALKTLINSARISDAFKITVILPTFPFARQDKHFSREGITARMFAQELEMLGVNTVITLDIHNLAIAGFFNKTVFENLKGFRDLNKYVKQNLPLENLVVSSPDIGGLKRAENYASELKINLVSIYKERNYKKIDAIDKMYVIGDVKNKDVLLVDDMIDTGGTLFNAAKLLKEKGANKIYFACSLPFLNPPSKERFDSLYKDGSLEYLIATNAVYHAQEFLENTPWFKQIDVSDYFAKVIFNIFTYKSISNLLKNIKS